MLNKKEVVSERMSNNLLTAKSLLYVSFAFSTLFSAEEISSTGSAHKVKTNYYSGHADNPMEEMTAPIAFEKQQSPRVLDFTSCRKRDVPDIMILEGGSAKQIKRSAHGLTVEMNPGHAVRADGKIFHLEQFHFHTGEHLETGSEHAVIKKPGEKPYRYPGEIHFVHKTDGGDVGVVGVFVKVGKENQDLNFILDHAPSDSSGSNLCNERFSPRNLLPEKRVPAHYEGSLTTPPYNGPIKWMVLVDPIEVSAEQLKRLQGMIGDNARDVQKGKTPVVLDTNVHI